MRVFILISVLGAALAARPQDANGPSKTQPQRIVGGEDTVVEQYKFMSNMEYLSAGIFFTQWCGGSLITADAVLSAAHCYDGNSISQWRVRLGSSFASYGGTIHTVRQLINHAQYNGLTNDYDIAVIRLQNPAIAGERIGFARLAGLNYVLPDNAPTVVTGWGDLWSGGPQHEQLQHVTVNVINKEICAERYTNTEPYYPPITERMMCTGILDVGGKDACQGDYGGPVIHRGDVVVGVTSWGAGCGEPYFPGVNARVSALSSWIVSNAL